MILKYPGQIFEYKECKFVVGGMVQFHVEDGCRELAVIQELDTSKLTALCFSEPYEARGFRLDALTPMECSIPVETGHQYVLVYICEDTKGRYAKVLGISSDKSVLFYLLLEDMRGRPDVELSSSYTSETGDVICVNYESTSATNTVYISYSITPVAVYDKAKEDTAV